MEVVGGLCGWEGWVVCGCCGWEGWLVCVGECCEKEGCQSQNSIRHKGDLYYAFYIQTFLTLNVMYVCVPLILTEGQCYEKELR